MTAPNKYYIDCSVASDGGAGTIGDPWTRASGSKIQWALDSGITRDATDGDEIILTSTTHDTLGGTKLTFTTYGTPGFDAPLLITGSVVGAGIDGGGASIHSGSQAVHFRGLQLHNSGANAIVNSTSSSYLSPIMDCELYDSTDAAWRTTGNTNYSLAAGNWVHDCTYGFIVAGSAGGFHIYGNVFSNGATRDFTTCVKVPSHSEVVENVFILSGASHGIEVALFASRVVGNTVFSVAGTGTGINASTTESESLNDFIANNYVEGFSGAGGLGYQLKAASRYKHLAGNAAHNNTTNVTVDVSDSGLMRVYDGETYGVEILGATGLAKVGAATYANLAAYFAPVSSGAMLTGRWPFGGIKGAILSAPAAAGGLLRHPGMSGGING